MQLLSLFTLLPAVMVLAAPQPEPDNKEVKPSTTSTFSNFATTTPAHCNADNCARAITGTSFPLTCRQTHLADCSSLLAAATIYGGNNVQVVTATVTITRPTAKATTVFASGVGKTVTYTSACSNINSWASACQCWGVKAGTVTASTTLTVTSTVVV